ncbi:MAG TPA: FAD-dependent oxidoreductase [Acidimicrobiia bacterium]|nr:FAD-dependent oxidoreductase [Acidimicrobiia bacterium]
MSRTADIVVVGAGIAGVSIAYHLAVRHRAGQVVLVDPRAPLTLTSDKSTECYRNWWPNAAMVGLMNRSIDILEELAAETDFGLNRNGYLFVTAEEETLAEMSRRAEEIAGLGAAAEILDATRLRQSHDFLTLSAVGALHVGRAGWFRAQELGRWMLDRARERGATLVAESVTAIHEGTVSLSNGDEISADAIVVAAGPMASEVAAMAGVDLPLFSELHLKVAFKDHLGIIPRAAPLTIWSDPQRLDWTEGERAELEMGQRAELLGEMPIFCHFRPEGAPGSPWILALWDYHDRVIEPTWPIPQDPLYPEVVMRGLATMVPGLSAYRDRLPESVVDGGYYTKTVENRPLIGPAGDRIHLMTALSGFGVMAAAGGADLVARHIVGADLPEYADAFLLDRYTDPGYLAETEAADTGQL